MVNAVRQAKAQQQIAAMREQKRPRGVNAGFHGIATNALAGIVLSVSL